MKKALISPEERSFGGYRVADVCDTAFDVAAPFFWVDSEDWVAPDKCYFDPADQKIKLPPTPSAAQVVPESVTRFQARAALYQAGYFDAVTEIMSNPATPMLMKLAWQDAQEFRRDSSTVQALSQILGLTSEQVDQLFIAASGISA
ncbi:hypothetical protein [Rhodoferax mekongensis]|uniref:Uncharacterized protein n=1 Tax=Rhodoferax mekongensis TaxID=3068341 RepID=A0ABZ0B2H3_9BURK|nr:hypothetical protein [Rhodoferax sp. TBRC 17307]WNO06053.1 hypothetical protein RAN89_06380 [Rhodoferax sp. TBRC 17307]